VLGTRRRDSLLRVPDEPLSAAERSRHIEAVVEVAEVLGRFEGLFERRAREPERRGEPLELALIDGHARMVPRASAICSTA